MQENFAAASRFPKHWAHLTVAVSYLASYTLVVLFPASNSFIKVFWFGTTKLARRPGILELFFQTAAAQSDSLALLAVRCLHRRERLFNFLRAGSNFNFEFSILDRGSFEPASFLRRCCAVW